MSLDAANVSVKLRVEAEETPTREGAVVSIVISGAVTVAGTGEVTADSGKYSICSGGSKSDISIYLLKKKTSPNTPHCHV